MLEDTLLQVNKPARYIGEEWNVSRKDFTKAKIKFALCFPDLYEIGMSNLGVRILYGLLNTIADLSCERFFSPDFDMEKILRATKSEIFSLESKKSLKEFDIIGFSLSYELSYTNVLNILDLGGIPLKSSSRDLSFPLVIGGGCCTLNPEPMHEFFDLFVIGEAEEAILEIIDVYRNFKNKINASDMTKQDLLLLFSHIEGVYVPSFYEPSYNPEGKIEEFKPKIKEARPTIKKRFITDLDKAYFPLDWLIPYISIVCDRITLEIMRGCPNACRFCQARSQYFPYRQKSMKNILNEVSELYKRTGYEEVSLGGLSVSDYSELGPLVEDLTHGFKKDGISVSLPSIKAKAMTGKLSGLIARIKKTGFTFAPEAATEKLRKVLNKEIEISDLYKAVEQAYLYGWQHIKLYFMIGIPYEEEHDLDAILEFATYISDLRKKINKNPAQVNVSINTLIPKPHTPLQWLAMQDLESIQRKQGYLKKKLKNRRLKLSFHNSRMSFLEGVLSRGDRRLSEVILRSFIKGARFDAWGNYFNFDRWLEAFRDSKIEPRFYLKEKASDERLPWDFLEVGVNKDALLKEYKKVIAGE